MFSVVIGVRNRKCVAAEGRGAKLSQLLFVSGFHRDNYYHGSSEPKQIVQDWLSSMRVRKGVTTVTFLFANMQRSLAFRTGLLPPTDFARGGWFLCFDFRPVFLENLGSFVIRLLGRTLRVNSSGRVTRFTTHRTDIRLPAWNNRFRFFV